MPLCVPSANQSKCATFYGQNGKLLFECHEGAWRLKVITVQAVLPGDGTREREREREGGDVTRAGAWAHHRVLKHALLFMGPKDAAHIMLQCSKARRGEGRRG